MRGLKTMKILGDEIPLKTNLVRSLRTHRLMWCILAVTAFFDFASTLFFMTGIGIHVERNMLVRWLATMLGIVPGVALAKLLQLGAAAGFAALSFRHARAVLLLLVLINTLAVFANLFLEPRTAPV
jgi:hypothetical protein